MKNLLIIVTLLLAFLFQNCEGKKVSLPNKISESSVNLKSSVQDRSKNSEENYALIAEKIDSLEFFKIKSKFKPKAQKVEKITNLKIAQKMLAGVVDFTDYDYQKEKDMIKKIKFRNGKQLENEVDFTEAVFVAYFPTEDILLMEGGHQTDLSYNLKTGETTESAGNPDVISTSPAGKYRLNGNFGGQQCFTYFIQKKVGGNYKKVVAFDKDFDKIMAEWLCYVGDSFWTDDQTIYIRDKSNFSEDGSDNLYYKLKIKE